MKIVCPQEDLLNRLQIVARGVSQRSTVQILSGVLIRAEAGGAIELAATDMELSVRAASRPRWPNRDRRCSREGCCSRSSARCRNSR